MRSRRSNISNLEVDRRNIEKWSLYVQKCVRDRKQASRYMKSREEKQAYYLMK